MMEKVPAKIVDGVIAKNDAHRRSFAPFWDKKLGGLPPVGPKNLTNLDLPAPEFRRGGDFNASKICRYLLNNQQYIVRTSKMKSPFLGFEGMPTDFEFNTPISKNEALISKDFEKNRTDFEGFRIDFENVKPFRSSATPETPPDPKGLKY